MAKSVRVDQMKPGRVGDAVRWKPNGPTCSSSRASWGS